MPKIKKKTKSSNVLKFSFTETLKSESWNDSRKFQETWKPSLKPTLLLIIVNYVAWENSLRLTWCKKESVVCEALFYLKWPDWIFLGGYLQSLSINYVGMSKDTEKKLPKLYYIKMTISYDLGFIAIGVSMAT